MGGTLWKVLGRSNADRDPLAEEAPPVEDRRSHRRGTLGIVIVGVPLLILVVLTLGGFVLATLVPAVQRAYIRDIRRSLARNPPSCSPWPS